MEKLRFGVILGITLVFMSDIQAQEQSVQPVQQHESTPAESTLVEHQSATSEEASVIQEEAEDYPDPNLVPYRTRKSLLVHFFALPAKIWRLLWTPLGETIIWVEQNRVHQKVINFFLNDERTAGFFPLLSLGGKTGAAGGLTLFHNDLFDQRKKINFSFLYSSTANNNATLAYSDSALFGSSFYFDLLAEYFNDNDENLFIRDDVTLADLVNSSIMANQSKEEDETSYSTEQGWVNLNLGYAISERVGLGLTSTFKRANIGSGSGFGGEDFPDAIPGAGNTSLFSIGSTVMFNFRNGWPRTLSGTVIQFGYQYNRELNGSRFEYNRYNIEVHQFIPIPFLAKNRRLAVRGIFEKMDRIGDKQIPFYELSTIGDAATLRGYDENRFRGRGSLLFNFEYRYPVWDTWDAVIFIDEGQVFDDLNEISFDRFHFAAGTGLRFMSPTGFAMRFEVGFSREMVRALFQITPNF